MSAFIVADNTINNIVNWLRRDVGLDRFSRIPHTLTELGFDTGTPGWAERLGYALFQLNSIAVAARYGSGEAVRFRKLDYRYEVIEPVPFVQVLKSFTGQDGIERTGIEVILEDLVFVDSMPKEI